MEIFPTKIHLLNEFVLMKNLDKVDIDHIGRRRLGNIVASRNIDCSLQSQKAFIPKYVFLELFPM